MAVTAVATAIMVATMAITTEGLTSIFSATAMAEAGTPSIIAIEVQEVVEWPTPAVADTVAVEGVGTEVAATAAVGEGIKLRNS